eukprot:6837643-Karenia_brevis.AAC.1
MSRRCLHWLGLQSANKRYQPKAAQAGEGSGRLRDIRLPMRAVCALSARSGETLVPEMSNSPAGSNG